MVHPKIRAVMDYWPAATAVGVVMSIVGSIIVYVGTLAMNQVVRATIDNYRPQYAQDFELAITANTHALEAHTASLNRLDITTAELNRDVKATLRLLAE